MKIQLLHFLQQLQLMVKLIAVRGICPERKNY